MAKRVEHLQADKAGKQLRRPMPGTFFGEDTETSQTRPACVTISKPVEEVYAFARDLTNMKYFIRGLQDIQVLSEKLSHWIFEKEGKRYEYDSEIIAEEPNRLFAWRSLDKTISDQVGVVTFEPAIGGRGTIVSMRTTSDRNPGKVAGALSYYAGRDPKSESYINLRRMKAYMETGEVPTVEGQPNGRDEDNNQRKN